jgi:hypothetical protein
VFGRDPSFDPRHSSIVRTEARKLRARLAKYYRIEGSVRRSGDRVRILVQIDDTGSERTAWSQTYGRKVGGAFRVQEEIARNIVERLTSRSYVRQPTAAIEGESGGSLGPTRVWPMRTSCCR